MPLVSPPQSLLGKKALDLNNALGIPASIRGKTRSGGGGRRDREKEGGGKGRGIEAWGDL